MDSVIVLCFVVRYFASILVLQSSRWGRERAGCFALFVFLVSRDCCVALPHNVTRLSSVCDCVFPSYSLTIFANVCNGVQEKNPLIWLLRAICLLLETIKSGLRNSF